MILHNWLVNLRGTVDGFKEVDLHQEHDNFWIKVIYAAKGANKSWKWLSMITVCIATLRTAMRTVQKSFEIPAYGVKHTSPSTTAEVTRLAQTLSEEKVQSYVSDRPYNERVRIARDLLLEGSQYAHKPNAFKLFTEDPRRARNIGQTAPPEDDSEEEQEERQESDEEEIDEGPTPDDLAVDDEEDYSMVNLLLQQTQQMI